MTKALIYCRVSSERQVNEGNGNGSQEQRCRNRAREKGWPVSKVFPDEGVSGKLFERPAMRQLLEYIDSHPSDKYIVIFDDLSRFARDVQVHIQLKLEFEKRGVKRECLNFGFDDSEESEYAELILAAGNQYQRKSNRRQVIQKQKARLEKGYWPFCLPPGLINEKHQMHGKISVPREPFATIFKTAIENFQDRLLTTQLDVVDFINNEYKVRGISKVISLHGVQLILTEILYAGYIEYPPWEVTKRKAAFDGFISIETYDAVQVILHDRSKPKVRRDTNPEFPLRGLILCSQCNKPLTASFHHGHKGQKYPHYFCKTKGCALKDKSLHRAIIHEDFSTLLDEAPLDKPMKDLAIAVLTDVWGQHQSQQIKEQLSHHKEVQEVTDTITRLTERIGKTTSNTLVQTYEAELEKLAVKKEQLSDVSYPTQLTSEMFGTATRKVLDVLEKPVTMWQSDSLDDKLTVFFMHFDQKPVYDKNLKFGTPNLAQPVELIRSLGSAKISSVEMPSNELGSEEIHQKRLQA